jgi:hypothetical protein
MFSVFFGLSHLLEQGGNKEWFVQTPEHSFKNTFVSVYCWSSSLQEVAHLILPVFMRSGAPAAHEVSKARKRSHKICQALRKESEKALGQEKKIVSLHFRATS